MSPCSRASLRARRAARRRSTYGTITSHSRAMTTMAVAQRATVTCGLVCSARGAREEDDPAGLARDLIERAHHLGLPPAALGLHRDRGPHPLLELPPELGYDPLLILFEGDLAFRDQLLAVARTHPQELHGSIMSRTGSRPGRSFAPSERAVRRRT